MAVARPLRGRLVVGKLRTTWLTLATAMFGGFMVVLLTSSCFSGSVDAANAAGKLKRLGWEVSWTPSSGTVLDGTIFYNARFRGTNVFTDMRVPFSYVDYTDNLPPYRDIVDELGALAWDKKTWTFRGCKGQRTRRDDGVPGYLVDCDYTFDVPGSLWTEHPPDERAPICALYKYNQRLYLYADGSFRPEVITWGPGFPNPHNYVIGIRIDIAVGKNGNALDAGFARGSGGWEKVGREQYRRGGRTDNNGYAWYVAGGENGMPPSVSFKPGADNGILWFLDSNAENPDSMDGKKQGTTPAEFAQPAEALAGRRDLYLWYTGTGFNGGCRTIPLAIGPELITLQGY